MQAQAATPTVWQGPRWEAAEPWLFLAALGFSEIVSDIWQPVVGLWLHAVLAAVLLARGAQGQGGARGSFYIAASIMAVVRIVSFAISPSFAPGVWYYVAAEGPLLAAGVAAARVLDLSPKALGLAISRRNFLDIPVAATGVPAGILESRIIHPAALASGLHWEHLLLPTILVVIFTGLTEELVFRGVIQVSAIRWLGVLPGILFTALGWSLLHIGWLSGPDVLFVFAVGLVWGVARYWTRSIYGTSLAHGSANVILFLIVPNLH